MNFTKYFDGIAKGIYEDKIEGNYTLSSGTGGHILFLSTVGKKFNRPEYVNMAINLLDKNVELSSRNEFQELFIGITGTAWLIRYLIELRVLDPDTQKDLIDVDRFLRNNIENNKNENRPGLMYGWSGIGLYYLEKYNNGDLTAANDISLIIKILQRLSCKKGQTISWPDFELFKQGNGRQLHNIGLAHGIPGIISFLARVYKVGIEKKEIFELIERSVNWLLNKELNSDNVSLFPSLVEDQMRQDAQSRLGWCYGDLCVAKALLDAETVLKNNECYSNAIRIIEHTMNRNVVTAKLTVEDNRIDPTFCHGISSICHLYNRMHQITQLESIKERSIYWFNKLLNASSLNDKGDISFLGYKYISEENIIWENNSSLLHGSSGIGLVISSFISKSRNDNWDNILLTSNICYE